MRSDRPARLAPVRVLGFIAICFVVLTVISVLHQRFGNSPPEQVPAKPSPNREITVGEFHRLKAHNDYITSVDFSRDGRWIISAGADGMVKVWDAANGGEVRQLTVNGQHRVTNWAYSARFSSDGKLIACGSGDKTVRIWEAGTGKEVFRLRGHTGQVDYVAFFPDGRRILSNDGGLAQIGTPRIWDITTGRELARISQYARCVALSPDGNRLLLSDGNTTLLWDVGANHSLLDFGPHSFTHVMAFSLDGRIVATGDYVVFLRSASNGKEIHALNRTEELAGVAFSPRGDRLISGEKGGTLHLWDVRTGDELARFNIRDLRLSCVTYSPSGHGAILGTMEGFLIFIRLPEGYSKLHSK